MKLRGAAHHVVVVADGAEIARHPRATRQLLLVDAAHFDGPSTATVRAPTPLGARARLQLAALPAGGDAVTTRPLGEYVALVDHLARHSGAEGTR